MGDDVLHLVPRAEIGEADRDHAAGREIPGADGDQQQDESQQQVRDGQQRGGCAGGDAIGPAAPAAGGPDAQRDGDQPGERHRRHREKQRVAGAWPEQGAHRACCAPPSSRGRRAATSAAIARISRGADGPIRTGRAGHQSWPATPGDPASARRRRSRVTLPRGGTTRRRPRAKPRPHGPAAGRGTAQRHPSATLFRGLFCGTYIFSPRQHPFCKTGKPWCLLFVSFAPPSGLLEICYGAQQLG